MEEIINKLFIRFKLHDLFQNHLIISQKEDRSHFYNWISESWYNNIIYQIMDLPYFEKGVAKEVPEMSKKVLIETVSNYISSLKKGFKTGNACHLDIYSPYGASNIKKTFLKVL